MGSKKPLAILKNFSDSQKMLNGGVIVVTGGAGLLGRLFVRAIIEHDGIAIVADSNGHAATQFSEELALIRPGRVDAVCTDIADKISVCALIDLVHKQYGRIDGLVNNAYPRNSNYGRKLENVTYDDFCENVNHHLGGYFLVSQQFSSYFQSHGGGSIVNMASIYGTMAPRFEIYNGTLMTMPVEYAAIKAGVIQLTKYFAQYYKRDGVRFNSLSPGGIINQQPETFLQKYNAHCGVKGMLDPADVTGTMLFLLSEASKHITGQNIIVDDGFSL
jgi:NAD(P)-dependent dehydrogenase (short-subunit alcohol dehydrogenase family)